MSRWEVFLDVAQINQGRRNNESRLPVSADSTFTFQIVDTNENPFDNSSTDESLYNDGSQVMPLDFEEDDNAHDIDSDTFIAKYNFPCSKLVDQDYDVELSDGPLTGWVEYEELPISNSCFDNGKPLNLKDKMENYVQHNTDPSADPIYDELEVSRSEYAGVKNQPSTKYSNGLSLLHGASFASDGPLPHNYFRHNLSASYSKNGLKLYFTVLTSSVVSIFNLTTTHNYFDPICSIDMAQLHIIDRDILEGCIDIHQPNAINNMLITEYKGVDVLITVDDAGFVKFVEIDKLIRKVKSQKKSDVGATKGLRQGIDYFLFKNDMSPEFDDNYIIDSCSIFQTLKVNSSGWDIACAGDFIGISSNAHKITVFDLTTKSKVESPKLHHNIPSLDIILNNDESHDYKYFVVCGTYSGILTLLGGDCSRLEVIDSVVLHSPIWTTKFVTKDCFLNVKKPSEISGDLLFENKGKLNTLFRNSNILDPNFKSDSSNKTFEIAGKFIKLKIPTLSTRQYIDEYENCSDLVNSRDEVLRMERIYKKWVKKGFTDSVLDSTLIVVCTNLQMGTFTLRELINTNTCAVVFPIVLNPRILNNPDVTEYAQPLPCYEFLNRMYHSILIPELQCIVVATQAGQIEVFRFTEYKGVKSMRLELILMNFEERRSGYVPIVIVGLSAFKCGYNNKGEPIFRINATDNNGLTKSITIGR